MKNHINISSILHTAMKGRSTLENYGQILAKKIAQGGNPHSQHPTQLLCTWPPIVLATA